MKHEEQKPLSPRIEKQLRLMQQVYKLEDKTVDFMRETIRRMENSMPPKDYNNPLDIVRYSRPAPSEIKPARETVINSDDVLDLRIAMETSESLEEFLELV